MTIDALLLVAALVAMTVALVRSRLEADLVTLATLLFLIIVGVLPAGEAVMGFANEGMLTIGFLFVVAAGVQRSGALDRLSGFLFGHPGRGERSLLARLLIPTAVLSGFVNNTPLVAVLVPAARRFSRLYGVPPSRVLMPLSFATMLGGTCTLLGTSTNLVISGMLQERGHPGLGLFETAPVGIGLAVVGVAFLIVLAPSLLPDRSETVDELTKTQREFICEVKVTPAYAHLGATVEKAGLRHLTGLFLFEIHRGDERIAPVPPTEQLKVDDRLLFTGDPTTIVELQRTAGLEAPLDDRLEVSLRDEGRRLFEVVISHRSPLVGQTVRESRFRGRFGAAILAIHRHGERLEKKVGDHTLRPGDTLLLVADPAFPQRFEYSQHFYVVTAPDDDEHQRSDGKALIAGTVGLGMFAVILAGLLPPVVACGAAALLVVVTGCVSAGDARRAVDLKVLLIIAASLGIGRAVERAGVADILGEGLAAVAPAGPWALFLAVFAVTATVSLVVSNHAAAALLLPVALATAVAADLDPRPFALVVAFGASASFATPLGYQTNLLVWGPGNYRFMDFVRLGLPLTILVGVLVSGLLSAMSIA